MVHSDFQTPDSHLVRARQALRDRACRPLIVVGARSYVTPCLECPFGTGNDRLDLGVAGSNLERISQNTGIALQLGD